ncbi:molybdenum cofactor guanylyltransferase MobA [Serratia microhaemolytica]|uniref:molybdenum cofactor guanylyltransferase MobA n=1 Tax=Serratia microhaemolytica TaxID=2675110 RepID=UPI000FDD553B|nr:molybdenum cofactor guanylyltransferase MobA [Serratia microhaemolytica]
MRTEITGVILAGGTARRMGGIDKGLLMVGNQPLYQHVLARLKPQVSRILINANRNLESYRHSGWPIIPDLTTDYCGPLAGMLATMKASQNEWISCVPCDVPDFPSDLVTQLWQQKGNALAAYAADRQRAHPTFALLHTSLAGKLADYLAAGERKLMLFMATIAAQAVVFNADTDVFRNLNTLQECQQWWQEKNIRR